MRTGVEKVNCGFKPRSSRFSPAEASSGVTKDVWMSLIGHSSTVGNHAKQYNCETGVSRWQIGVVEIRTVSSIQPDCGNQEGRTIIVRRRGQSIEKWSVVPIAEPWVEPMGLSFLCECIQAVPGRLLLFFSVYLSALEIPTHIETRNEKQKPVQRASLHTDNNKARASWQMEKWKNTEIRSRWSFVSGAAGFFPGIPVFFVGCDWPASSAMVPIEGVLWYGMVIIDDCGIDNHHGLGPP